MNKVISLYTPEQVASHHTSIGNIYNISNWNFQYIIPKK